LSVTIPAGAAALGERAFNPALADIGIGTTVTWVNADSVAHTSTSNQAGWNSNTLAPGARFSLKYDTAGTFAYHCAIHPGMVGTVVVK
jgi:plastocyanin